MTSWLGWVAQLSDLGKLLQRFWTHLPMVEWLPGKEGDSCWRHLHGRSPRMPQMMVTRNCNAEVCEHVKRRMMQISGLVLFAEFAWPLTAYTLLISTQHLSAWLSCQSNWAEGNKKQKPFKLRFGIQLSFSLGPEGNVSCRFCLFILFSCFKVHLGKYQKYLCKVFVLFGRCYSGAELSVHLKMREGHMAWILLSSSGVPCRLRCSVWIWVNHTFDKSDCCTFFLWLWSFLELWQLFV